MGKANSKKVGRNERSAPKPRKSPAFDAAVKKLEALKLRQRIEPALWKPLTMRRAIAQARNVSREPWRRAVKVVFGTGVLELPDLRQLDLFGSAA